MIDQNLTRREAVKLGGATLAGVGLPAGASSAVPAVAMVPAYPDFRGKVVLFYTEKGESHILSDPQFAVIAGRLFLTGTAPARDHWTDGAASGIAWDLVGSYFAFDSIEDYRARGEQLKKKKAQQAEGA
jgi:hypothetical protein